MEVKSIDDIRLGMFLKKTEESQPVVVAGWETVQDLDGTKIRYFKTVDFKDSIISARGLGSVSQYKFWSYSYDGEYYAIPS